MTDNVTQAKALLPCPFCGGEASEAGRIRFSKPLDDTTWEDGSEITEAFYVNCMKCGAVSRSGIVGGFQTKAEAIARWNTRAFAKEATPSASVERLTHASTYAAFTDGMKAAAEICGSLAETTYDDADGFEAATGCEAAIMRVVKEQRAQQSTLPVPSAPQGGE